MTFFALECFEVQDGSDAPSGFGNGVHTAWGKNPETSPLKEQLQLLLDPGVLPRQHRYLLVISDRLIDLTT